jgi:hypothetical protein
MGSLCGERRAHGNDDHRGHYGDKCRTHGFSSYVFALSPPQVANPTQPDRFLYRNKLPLDAAAATFPIGDGRPGYEGCDGLLCSNDEIAASVGVLRAGTSLPARPRLPCCPALLSRGSRGHGAGIEPLCSQFPVTSETRCKVPRLERRAWRHFGMRRAWPRRSLRCQTRRRGPG